MLSVISPAKTLDYDSPVTTSKATQPEFLERSEALVTDARQLDPADIRSLMGVSENIAALNHQRFMDWHRPFDKDNARQAILAFKGDVYTGLEAETLNATQLAYAQKHLRILCQYILVLPRPVHHCPKHPPSQIIHELRIKIKLHKLISPH